MERPRRWQGLSCLTLYIQYSRLHITRDDLYCARNQWFTGKGLDNNLLRPVPRLQMRGGERITEITEIERVHRGTLGEFEFVLIEERV